MPHLTSISYYPVKSMRGWDLAQAIMTPRGLENDRLIMVTDPDGMFFTQRELPRLAAIRPTFDGDTLTLTATNLDAITLPIRRAGAVRPVTIWDSEAEAIDQGEPAAEWLSRFFGREVRLMRLTDDAVIPVTSKYAVTPRDEVSFADGFPVLIVSQESLDDLNARMETPVPMNRFRPNLVVAGFGPFAEDGWKRIRIGQIELAVVKPCARCLVTTHDQGTGERIGKEPLRTLATFRKVGSHVMFAMNAIPLTFGDIRVGDEVEVLEEEAVVK
jgi:MOSC domain-containing protein